jgi:hypothetical protein
MSPQIGWVLQEEVAPRLKSAIPNAVHGVGSEDAEELVQDALALAARLMDSNEKSGKQVTPGNVAYYTVGHVRSGRGVEDLDREVLDVEQDLGGVFHHARNGRELVQHALDGHEGDGRPRDGGQQHAPERVAQRSAVAPLQRLNYESPVILSDLHCFNLRLFDFDHPLTLLVIDLGHARAELNASRTRRSGAP